LFIIVSFQLPRLRSCFFQLIGNSIIYETKFIVIE
jgi:hypothetical protein